MKQFILQVLVTCVSVFAIAFTLGSVLPARGNEVIVLPFDAACVDKVIGDVMYYDCPDAYDDVQEIECTPTAIEAWAYNEVDSLLFYDDGDGLRLGTISEVHF